MAVCGIYILVPGRAPFQKVRERVALPARAELRPERPRYPYSVIPGGIYTDAEVHGALRSDAVAASHYAGFFHGQVHPTVLPHPLLRYVSFRKDDRIYWTRRPVTLRAGETLLTDGNRFARARCGNQISEIPQLPVLTEDLPPETWEKPIEEPNAGPVSNTPQPSSDHTPAGPPRVAPEVFMATNLVGLAAASPSVNSGAPFLWAGGATGGLIPFSPTASSEGAPPVNVLELRPNPPDSRPIVDLPTGIPQPAASIPPPVIVFAGKPPTALRPPYQHPLPSPEPAPSTLDVPGVPSNPPATLQTPTDEPLPGDAPGPPLLGPPSDLPRPPIVPPTDRPASPVPVPEPAVFLLVGLGLLLLGASRSVR